MQQEKYYPQGWLRVIIEFSGKPKVGSFSLLFKQPAIAKNSSVSPTNCGGCETPTTHKINKTKGNYKNKVFGDFYV
jgi:hypothetical protein